MRVLFLGPECRLIEKCLAGKGHDVIRKEDAIDISFLVDSKIQFGISYRYSKIIRQSEIEWFGDKLVNLHISLLPWNKGADPNLWSYLEETPRGVTIHRIDAGIDTGDILLQREVVIDTERETLRTSYERLSMEIESLFVDNCDAILCGNLRASKQGEIGSFHYSRDKGKYLYLMEARGWNTPIFEVLGKAVRH